MVRGAFDTLVDLAETLNLFCSEGRSGTFHIVTRDNHTAYFGLLAGQIVQVRYRIRKDMRALEQMLSITQGSYTFKENAWVDASATTLPSTAEILALLGAAKPGNPAPSDPGSRASRRPNPPADRAVASTPVANTPVVSASQRESEPLPSSTQFLLLNILTHYAGPAASLLGRSVFAKTSDTGEAIELLAQKIPDASQARAFVSEARAQLGHLL